jgi:hypothetical protein
MDRIYDTEKYQIGTVSGGFVEDNYEKTVGRVHRAGGGDVYDNSDYNWRIGEVSKDGTVKKEDGTKVGDVRGTRVYDASGNEVGQVSASTHTTWATGITDAHKAGAALLLLLMPRMQ